MKFIVIISLFVFTGCSFNTDKLLKSSINNDTYVPWWVDKEVK